MCFQFYEKNLLNISFILSRLDEIGIQHEITETLHINKHIYK